MLARGWSLNDEKRNMPRAMARIFAKKFIV